MATHETLAALFTDTADAIREKTGDTAAIVADNFPAAIRAISIPKQFSDVITNADTLQVTGNYAMTTYFTSLTPICAMGDDGEVIIILSNKSSSYYISFETSGTIPSGASARSTYTTKPGKADCLHALCITGLTGKYTMTLNAANFTSNCLYVYVRVTAV